MMIQRSKDIAHYDAIVVGSGISGGWAAMELCKSGLRTLVLERGRNVEHIKDYPTSTLHPWDFPTSFLNSKEDQARDPVQSQAYDPTTKHFYVRDSEHPYIQEQPFNWFRGYQVGGRSLTWGRQCYRLSDLDFQANIHDSIGVDWPIRYRDIEPWYSYVEDFIGVSGRSEKLKHLPDGCFLPALPLNCIEKHLAESIRKNYDNRLLTIARVANLTKGWGGRGPCQSRNLCSRGCPYSGYFSSNSSTIPIAASTGNLTLRPFSIVKEVIYDDKSEKAIGVRIVDSISLDEHTFYSKIIFINASTIGTASILLNSKSDRFPDGLGNDSGQVGHNLMDHHSSAGAYGVFDGFNDFYYKGRRPCGFLIPRFRNVDGSEKSSFIRGYNLQGVGSRKEWAERIDDPGFGVEFKNRLTKPGPWTIWMAGWGECLPYFENRVVLDDEKKDKWGLPLVRINFSFRENEARMKEDIMESAAEMLQKANFTDIEKFNYKQPGGMAVHEMGTARMGRDPKTSVLNGFNQMHSVRNVFITDGSCMTSSACQNPSLTYMALTARACNFAANELKRGTF